MDELRIFIELTSEEVYGGYADDEDDFEPSYNEDEGFDPYMGDYSWDC